MPSDREPPVRSAHAARTLGAAWTCAALLSCGEAGGPVGPGIGRREEDAGVRLEDPPAPPQADVGFACGESTRTAPEGLRRLTMTQYRNTVRDLVGLALADVHAAESLLASAGLDAVPRDRREPSAKDPHGSYRRLDQAVDQTHVDETFRVARALGRALTAPEHLAQVVGACATDSDETNDEACLTDFIQRFGARALRRPLDEDDQHFYRVVYGSDPTANPAGYADVITVMLSSPDLLYFVEHGLEEPDDEAGTYPLSPYELASRLSYHFWQTLPDDALWQAAEDGSLLDAEVLTAQVERLMADERARTTVMELFSDWLRLDDLPALDARANDLVYAAFAGSDLPDAALRQEIIDDALDMLAYYTWSEPAGLEALFTSELSFARGPRLARIYGVEPWDGRGAPPSLPAGERPGLLTRAWFLASGSASTRPILRGVFVRRNLLCDELAPPPSNVVAVPPALRADQTTREVIEELTEQPGTSCASCHATLINPLGFVFEGFDALGRVQQEQRLFDDGTQVGALPIDTTAVPRVTAEDERVVEGPAGLSQIMLESGKLEACLARQYFRFTFGRYEDLTRDGCVLERLRARLVESGRIRDMLREAALLPEFRRRRFEP